MMSSKRSWLGAALLALLMAVTGAVLLRGQSLALLGRALLQAKPQFILLGLGLMLVYVGCEALCTHQILARLGHRVPYRRCMGYSFVGFYVSSITPSATGGQPAQVYYMSRDQIPPAHGALNMMMIACCYQAATLIWGAGVWLLLPGLHDAMGGGMGLLLLYGGGMMVLLTLGMGAVMFLPNTARRFTTGLLALLAGLGIVRDLASAREKLERQLGEYARGAACIRANPGLTVRLLVLCLVQLGALFSVPWAVYLAFGLTGQSWAEVAGLQALLTLAVCNLPLPGAVGPAEGGFVTAFSAVFGSALVTPAMLVSRGISFYAFLALSACVALAVHLRTSREARQRAIREMKRGQTGLRTRAVHAYLMSAD